MAFPIQGYKTLMPELDASDAKAGWPLESRRVWPDLGLSIYLGHTLSRFVPPLESRVGVLPFGE